MNFIKTIAVGALLLLGAKAFAEQAPLTLQAALTEVLDRHPAIAATQAQAEALAAVPEQTATLPDPRLMLNISSLPVDSFAFGEEPMTQVQIGLSQDFPAPGKLGLQKASAEQEAGAAAIDVGEVRLRLARDVKRTWWQLFYLDRALEIVQRNQELLRQFVTIAQTKYKVGQGLQQDVLLAQLELSKLLDWQIRLQGMRSAAQARLNALLDRRPVGQPLQLAPLADARLPNVLDEARLVERAYAARPLLEAQRRRIEAARTRVDLARRDYYPDFRLAALYGQRDGFTDMFSVELSLNLPIHTGSRQDKAVDQRSSELLRNTFALQDQQLGIAAEIGNAMADYRRLKEQVLLLETGIIPQARQTVDSMLAGYQTNKVDFLNVVRAQITLYDYETQYWEAVSSANQALAELAALVGEETIYE